MEQLDLRGMGVALVTPFKSDKSIDYDALRVLIEYLIGNDCDYLVVLGTTAETPTLSKDERQDIKDFVRKQVAGRVPLIVGHGGNNTMELVEELKTGDFEGFGGIRFFYAEGYIGI